MLKKNQIITIAIESLSNDGNGVGHSDGIAVFVPYSAPGDRLKVKIVQVRSRYAYGRIEEILHASEHRIAADCPLFGKCGGCSFRHISYEFECLQKTKFVSDVLRRIGGINIEVLPCLPSPQVSRYRKKTIFPVMGTPACPGFFAPRSHRLLPAATCCMLQPERINLAAITACEFFDRFKIPAYDECARTGIVRSLFFRQGEDGWMLCVIASKDFFPHEKEFTAYMLERFPEIKTVVLNLNPTTGNTVLGDHNRILYGDGWIYDCICGVRARLSPHSFFQVNGPAADLLYKTVGEFAELSDGDTLLDLYCGTGTIGLSAVSPGTKLIGVEIVPQAVEDARQNALNLGLDADFLCMDAGKAAQTLVHRGASVDVIITDPPRKGCDDATIQAIIDLHAPRVIMVSCYPASLARDLKKLCASGYRIDRVRPIDLFPRTHHIETVALLVREDSSCQDSIN